LIKSFTLVLETIS